MKTETLEALQNYIEINYRTHRSIAENGQGADTTSLWEATSRLFGALEDEIGKDPVTEAMNVINSALDKARLK